MIQRNLDIRQKMKECGVAQWRLADYFNVHENTISHRLRHELSDADRERYLAAISEIAAEMGQTNETDK